jgi:hypothetical protein
MKRSSYPTLALLFFLLVILATIIKIRFYSPSIFEATRDDEQKLPSYFLESVDYIRHPNSGANWSRGEARPNVELPTHVSASLGKVTLWADYAHPEEGKVPLYIVNQSEEKQFYRSPFGNLQFMLEYKNSEGKWLRAQPYFVGNGSAYEEHSFLQLTLPPSHFFASFGYLPKEGKLYPIRYVSSKKVGLVSNEGEGLVSEADLHDVERDDLTASLIPLAIRKGLYWDKYASRNQIPDWNRTAVSLSLLKQLERNEAALAQVRKLKAFLQTRPDLDDVKAARAAANEVLSYNWPEEIKLDSLLNLCIKTVCEARWGRPKIGTLESEPLLIWELIPELLENRGWGQPLAKDRKIDPSIFKPLMMAAARVMKEGLEGVRHSANRVLDNYRILDEVISTSQLEEWILSPEIDLQKIAAKALARRTEWEKLSVLGLKLPPDRQLFVLQVLAYKGDHPYNDSAVARSPSGKFEVNFWQHCLKTRPLESFEKLSPGRSKTGEPQFNSVVHDPLHDYLKMEAEKGAMITTPYNLGQDSYKLLDAIQLLAAWRSQEDAPIFKLLLKHPGTIGRDDFVIRRFAREALILQAQPIPGE